MTIFNRLCGNCGGQFQGYPIVTPAPDKDTTGDLTGFEGCQNPLILQQNFCHSNWHIPASGHQKTSPLREMVRHGRLSDFFEFLSTHYGIEGEQESLEILGRFRHA
jgi:hypothetical protein